MNPISNSTPPDTPNPSRVAIFFSSMWGQVQRVGTAVQTIFTLFSSDSTQTEQDIQFENALQNTKKKITFLKEIKGLMSDYKNWNTLMRCLYPAIAESLNQSDQAALCYALTDLRHKFFRDELVYLEKNDMGNMAATKIYRMDLIDIQTYAREKGFQSPQRLGDVIKILNNVPIESIKQYNRKEHL